MIAPQIALVFEVFDNVLLIFIMKRVNIAYLSTTYLLFFYINIRLRLFLSFLPYPTNIIDPPTTPPSSLKRPTISQLSPELETPAKQSTIRAKLTV